MVEASHSPVIKDSGERRVFATGANRDRVDGKGAFHLLPFHGLERVCRIFEVGGKKYTPNNWRLGMNVSEYYNSALRHAVKAANGWNDEDHPAMAAWNMLCAMETQWMCEQGFLPKELNDIQNFLTAEGIQVAFEEIRLTNKKRLEELAAVKEAMTATTVVRQ
jgi:hypothetical protein